MIPNWIGGGAPANNQVEFHYTIFGSALVNSRRPANALSLRKISPYEIWALRRYAEKRWLISAQGCVLQPWENASHFLEDATPTKSGLRPVS